MLTRCSVDVSLKRVRLVEIEQSGMMGDWITPFIFRAEMAVSKPRDLSLMESELKDMLNNLSIQMLEIETLGIACPRLFDRRRYWSHGLWVQ